jgi:MFS family permease
MFKTFAGYGSVIRDLPFVAFLLVSMLMLIVYQQMYNSLSVFLRDTHGMPTQVFGFLMIASPVVVILFQFTTTQFVKVRPPFLMMALGTFFYMIGFGMYGFVAATWLFALALVIITVGEMIVMPVSSALAANFAPEDKRGRYMAVFGISWGLPSIIGPSAAGLILDNFNPYLLWYVAAGISAAAIGGFYLLHLWLGKRELFQPERSGSGAG